MNGKLKARHMGQSNNLFSKRLTINISETAFLKMVGLIKSSDGEIGWHGTVHRESRGVFAIDNIYVYPQVTTAASIETDQVSYEMWLMSLPDNVFNNLRMHGHSHYRFGVFASSKDDEHRRGIVSKMVDDMFYIFMIWNKRYEINTWIYDCSSRLVYNTDYVDHFAIIKNKRVPVKRVNPGLLNALLLDSTYSNFIREVRGVVTEYNGKPVNQQY